MKTITNYLPASRLDLEMSDLHFCAASYCFRNVSIGATAETFLSLINSLLIYFIEFKIVVKSCFIILPFFQVILKCCVLFGYTHIMHDRGVFVNTQKKTSKSLKKHKNYGNVYKSTILNKIKFRNSMKNPNV